MYCFTNTYSDIGIYMRIKKNRPHNSHHNDFDGIIFKQRSNDIYIWWSEEHDIKFITILKQPRHIQNGTTASSRQSSVPHHHCC